MNQFITTNFDFLLGLALGAAGALALYWAWQRLQTRRARRQRLQQRLQKTF